MMMISVFARAGVALTCVALSLSLSMPDQAAKAEARPLNEAALHSSMSRLGIDAATQTKLIDEIKAGVIPDSLRGGSPVAVKQFRRGGYDVTTEVYADGSADELGSEVGRPGGSNDLTAIPNEADRSASVGTAGVALQDANGYHTDATGITNCSRGNNGGVAYAQGCHVFYNGITSSNSFDANYQLYASGAKAQYIDGTAKFVSVVVSVSNEQVLTYDNGSRIRYSFNTSFNGLGNIPGYLQLKVGPSGAVVTGG